jgi:enterochelin esterase-like enzyme
LPEPQSTLFFLLLMAFFGAMMWWLVIAKQVVFRVLAAFLAFLPAMLFGVAAVNKYYDYYQNWNSAIADITGQGTPPGTGHAARPGAPTNLSSFLGHAIDTQLAAQYGYTLHMWVHGRLSGLTRSVYVYLPPQYFAPAFRSYRFPVIELIHGFPGEPQDWITVLNITTTLDTLIREGRAQPAVLVMPDANGGRGVSLQCLNQVNGPQDATFLAQDLPLHIARTLQVQPPGRAWGIAGYSEGGFCAANLSLQYSRTYGYAGVLSGYFKPIDNQLSHPSRKVQPFGGDARLKRLNTPAYLLRTLPAGTPIPHFWLGAGRADGGDVRQAEIFDQLLQLRQPAVTLDLVPSGGHTMFTWRMLAMPMLEWMTPKLASQAVQADARAVKKAAAKARHTPRASPSGARSAQARSPKPSRSPKPTAKPTTTKRNRTGH